MEQVSTPSDHLPKEGNIRRLRHMGERMRDENEANSSTERPSVE